jgi:hypothetical protein
MPTALRDGLPRYHELFGLIHWAVWITWARNQHAETPTGYDDLAICVVLGCVLKLRHRMDSCIDMGMLAVPKAKARHLEPLIPDDE